MVPPEGVLRHVYPLGDSPRRCLADGRWPKVNHGLGILHTTIKCKLQHALERLFLNRHHYKNDPRGTRYSSNGWRQRGRAVTRGAEEGEEEEEKV